MASKKVAVVAEEVCLPIITKLGYELVDLEYKKSHDGYHLTVTIDKEGGVDINDCETVHRAIDEPLDIADPTNGASYTLNVSSCGIDRPLKKECDYRRNLGKEISVKLYHSLDGQKLLQGVLVSYTDKDFVMKVNDQEITIKKDMVALAEPVITF